MVELTGRVSDELVEKCLSTAKQLAQEMSQVLCHRGPDDPGERVPLRLR
jgi:hypothetical protein